ncbi:MAG: glycerol-3-phosphate dehydrogenase [Oleiphilus sp.]|nr:MAG: glycerol-3-phosphate dehydrogenase [Oleiphilus sp.]
MKSEVQSYDIAVIGGGVNGTGIAADAAGRGLSVFLCEQNDFASGTSSTSSKLIHGGLRYLEHYEFRLVKEALAEREVLLKKAPHLVSPLKFTLPHRPHLRPAWMIRSGLFLYDHLSRRNSLPRARKVRFGEDSPLHANMKVGFEYYDCWVDDSRLVVTNALDAERHGATIKVQTECVSARFDEVSDSWQLTMREGASQRQFEIRAKHIVNASGPWLNQFLEHAFDGFKVPRRIRLIKGSHIIVPRTLSTDGAYILQNEDKRIVFVLPYLDDFTIIGTTDKEYFGSPEDVSIEDWEVEYLLNIYNQHFDKALGKQSIVSTYSGIRPLCDDESDDPSAITRDYTLELHERSKHSVVLSIYGGKITTYRKLAEAAMRTLQPYLPGKTMAWTKDSPLPGADVFGQSLNDIKTRIAKAVPWLDHLRLERFSKSYGLLCLGFLETASKPQDLGEDFGSGLTRAEVDYLIEKEWARCAEDILWRRSKLGLRLTDEQVQHLQSYVSDKVSKMEKPNGPDLSLVSNT